MSEDAVSARGATVSPVSERTTRVDADAVDK